MKRFGLLAAIFSAALALAQPYHQYVNPFIGTGGHGHTFPGASMPFGMVQLSPDTRIDGSWDGCGGYHYSDKVIYGFSHTHLSGTGVSDFGDIMLVPTVGEPSLSVNDYASTFSHDNEKAHAGFYSVTLDDGRIGVELTTSTRVGMHRYTFPDTGKANIVLDLNHRDKLLQGEVRITSPTAIEVLRRSEAWARDQYVFARIEFSKPMSVSAVNNNGFALAKGTDTYFARNGILSLAFSTQVKAGEQILVKVALSPTSHEGARLNMSEIKDWDFDGVKSDAAKAWDKELSKIEVPLEDQDKATVFYTALYHTMLQPNIAQDIDGKYRGRDMQIHQADGFDYYTVFSLWDTFRAAHPLYTLIDKKRTADFINTFIKQFEQGGALPVWELASNETGCMIGYHSVSVIADAMVKGIRGFDYAKAYEASKSSAMLDHLGLDAYKANGFISIDDEHESVSKTLEYAYDDWCIAQMAGPSLLAKPDDYAYFMDRSRNWQNVFDLQTGFMRPRRNGGWESPFEPREVNNNYTEGNSWQYTFFVPQDIPGLMEHFGMAANEPQRALALERKLDQLFSAPTATTGREQPDITGLIGQYAQGNEPSHHMAYLYHFAGKPEKTAQKIRYILDEFYKNTPDGLIGNEDCGQMSAWYILSAMGIYQVAPGKAEWTVNEPYFPSIKVNFEDGTSKTITASTPKEQLRTFGFERSFAGPAYPLAPSFRVPEIHAPAKSFLKDLSVTITHPRQDLELFYRVITAGKDNPPFRKYVGKVKLDKTSKVEAFVQDHKQNRSKVVSAQYFRKPNDYAVTLASKYNPQYHAGGPEGLTDGIRGNENWRKGDWQGYQGQDFEAVIDLKKKTPVRKVTVSLLQDSRSWILMPTKVEVETSVNGKTFTKQGHITISEDPKRDDTFVKSYVVEGMDGNVRFVKVRAVNYGKLPEWHQGFGGDAFIFIDEILVNQ